jgi:hypothetical protein
MKVGITKIGNSFLRMSSEIQNRLTQLCNKDKFLFLQGSEKIANFLPAENLLKFVKPLCFGQRELNRIKINRSCGFTFLLWWVNKSFLRSYNT